MLSKLRDATKLLKSHKVLHKIGKQWAVISIFTLILLGMPVLSQLPVHAKQIIKPVRVTRQASQLHQRILNHPAQNNVQNQNKSNANQVITLSKRPNITNNHYHLSKTVQPWYDRGHYSMKLMGQKNYGHVRASYYHSSDLKNPGNLLEISGHGLLKESYLLSKHLPKKMRYAGSDALLKNKPSDDVWRLKVNPGIYINNNPQSFIGTTPNYHILRFVTMDLSGLNTSQVKNFSFMFSTNVITNLLSKSDKENPLILAKLNNKEYGINQHDKGTILAESTLPTANAEESSDNRLGYINKLNISNFDTRQASDMNEMFGGQTLTDLALGKNFKLRLNKKALNVRGLNYSDDPSNLVRRLTVPSYLNLSDLNNDMIFWFPDAILEHEPIKNQNRKTVDSRTHKTYASELRNGTQLAGTYYIPMTKQQYHEYVKDLIDTKLGYRLLKKIVKHPSIYLSHHLTKSNFKNLRIILSNTGKCIMPTNSDYNLLQFNSNTSDSGKYSDYQLLPLRRIFGNDIFLGDADGHGYSDSINHSSELAPVLNLRLINNLRYEIGWIQGRKPTNARQEKETQIEYDDAKRFINRHPILSRHYLHKDTIIPSDNEDYNKQRFYIHEFLFKHPDKRTLFYKKNIKEQRKARKNDERQRIRYRNYAKRVKPYLHNYKKYFQYNLNNKYMKDLKKAFYTNSDYTNPGSSLYDMKGYINHKKLSNMINGSLDADRTYILNSDCTIEVKLINNPAYKFGWLLRHDKYSVKRHKHDLYNYNKVQSYINSHKYLKKAIFYFSNGSSSSEESPASIYIQGRMKKPKDFANKEIGKIHYIGIYHHKIYISNKSFDYTLLN